MHNYQPPGSGTLDRRDNLSAESFLEEYGIPGKPVILEGLTEDWPARTLWTLEYFREQYGALEMTVYRLNDESDQKVMRLDAYLDYMATNQDEEPYYLGNWIFSLDAPDLFSHYQRPPHFSSWDMRLPPEIRPMWKWLFIGPARSGSALHIDIMNSSAWNAVMVGTKRWIFYPPDQASYLYEGKVNAFDPDVDKFPLFAKARGLVGTQRPGDIVFTPSLWWHQVVNETSSVAITEDFVNETNVRWFNDYLNQHGEHEMRQSLLPYIPELAEDF